MMLNLIAAEWRKMLGNRYLAGFTVWLIPVGIAALMVLAMLAVIISDDAAMIFDFPNASWTGTLVDSWRLISSYPSNIMTRLLAMAFAAVVFAGEYQWSTWKSIVPRSNRTALILAKFITSVLILLVSYVVTGIVMTVGTGLAVTVAGLDFGPTLTGDVLSDLLRDYFREAVLATVMLTITVGYAAVAAMISRSILGSALGGFAITVFEPLVSLVLMIIGSVVGNPALINGYRFTALYNVENVRAQLVFSQAATTGFGEGFTAAPSLGFSVVMLVLWIVGLVGLTVWQFQRQDLG